MSAAPPPKKAKTSLEERHKSALSDLSSLGRVSHRLAMTDAGAPLEKVLSLLLPRLLSRIGTNQQNKRQIQAVAETDAQLVSLLRETYDKIHSKLVEMLSHAMKRVRSDDNCKVPCEAILNLLYEQHETDDGDNQNQMSVRQVDPFTLNLALAFLTMGLPRCSIPEVEALLPGLFFLLGNHAAGGLDSLSTPAKRGQSHQMSHLVLRAIEAIITPSITKPTAATQNNTASSEGSSTSPSSANKDHLAAARRFCQEQDSTAGAAVYDLLLDVLLYQPSAGNMPPPGLSQAGHERLGGGASITAKNWAAEMAPPARLKDLKLALLEFLAPCRRWAIFMENDNDNSENDVGMSRTVALLVVATGDVHPDVADRATLYLKTHLDSRRPQHNQQQRTNNNDTSADTTATTATTLLGDPMSLSCTLLSLVLGDNNAESALLFPKKNENVRTTVGITIDNTNNHDRTLVMSMKRRMMSEQSSSAIMDFVSGRVLEDHPHLFLLMMAGDNEDDASVTIRAMATLAVNATNQTLVTLGSGVPSSGLRASRPYVASARLLNSLCIRLTAFYDAAVLPDNNDDSSKNILDLLASSMSIACSVLAGASSPHSASRASSSSTGTMAANNGLIATRDACYGVVCTLSRSQFALAREGVIFTCGSSPSGTTSTINAAANGRIGSFVVSIETAALLFGCAANETETLRPRAVAALDALLGAYCRVYKKQQQDEELTTGEEAARDEMVLEDSTDDNPWSQTTLTSPNKNNSEDRSKGTGASKHFGSVVKSLLPLLWTAAQSSQPKASRVASSRWSTDLLKTLDLPNACHILCFLAGDADMTASSIAREGLGLGKKTGEPVVASDDPAGSSILLPDFGDLTTVLFETSSASRLSSPAGSSSSSSWRPKYYDFSPMGKAAAVRFGLMCLLSDLYGGEDDAVETYVRALAETLALFGGANTGGRGSTKGRESVDLLDECSICLAGCLSTSQFARTMIASETSPFTLQDMELLAISADSSKARRYLAEACGHVYQDYALWCNESSSSNKYDLAEWVATCQVTRALETCSHKLTEMQSNLFMVGEVHGAAFLGARCVRAFRLCAVDSTSDQNSDQSAVDSCWGFAASILTALGRGTLHSDEIIGNACASGLVIALSYEGVDASFLDRRLYPGTALTLAQLDMSLRKFGNGDHTDSSRATRLAEATGVVLAASTTGAGFTSTDHCDSDGKIDIGPARLQCVDALFTLLGSTAFRKDPEIALVTGEALALYADAFSPSGAVWTFMATEWPQDYDETYANQLPPHQQVLYILLKRELSSSSPHKRNSCATALLAVTARAAKMVNENLGLAKRAFVCELLERLSDVQSAFISLLGYPKSKQLARESCCLGLAACYGLAEAVALGGETMNDRLLRAFGQTTNYGGSALMETPAERRRRENRDNVNEEASAISMMESFGMETEIGGTSGMGEAALGAYKEMASAALSLGRPDVLYALMLLSVSHPIWFTAGPRERYNTASLLGAGVERATLLELLAGDNVIPALLRGCHAPHKQTRDQMVALWLGITGGGAESRLVITQHLLPTIDALIEDASNKLWRARVGACGALTEVIVGRSWDDLGGGGPALDDDDIFNAGKGAGVTAAVRLVRLWRVAMRALDDVRLAVRESGESLARSLRSLTIRLCDPSAMLKSPDESTAARLVAFNPETRLKADKDTAAAAAAAAATSLRWLVRHGLNQACAEATGACMSCLVGIVDIARPITLQPVLPELVESLLMAISGLEPAALNYLQVRTAGQESTGGANAYDRLERFRLQMAQSGPIAGALTKIFDMMPSTALETQKEVIPRLDSALRCGAGFSTRASAADAVSTLCRTCPGAFKFSGHSGTNPTVRILRALYFASERERGAGARDKMAHALGNLARLSPGPSVRSLARRACERYSCATGSNDDPEVRRASAAAVHAITVRGLIACSDETLSVAFLGQRDADAKIASLWKEVWEEGGSAANSNVRSNKSTISNDFGVLLHEKLLPHLVRACVDALEDVSWARRVAACGAITELCDLNVLSPAPQSSGQRTETSDNQDCVRARRRAQASNAVLRACVKLIVKSRVWKGKHEVLKASVKVAGKWTICNSQNNLSGYGWDGNGGHCPWAPIVLSNERHLNDLFSGDHWFEEEHTALEETGWQMSVQATLRPRAEKDSNVAETAIDFENCDEVLGDDDYASEAEELDVPLIEASGALTFSGLCRILLEQGMPVVSPSSVSSSPEDILPYRAAALQGLADLLSSLSSSSAGASRLQYVYGILGPTLIGVVDSENRFGISDESRKEQPPLIVAKITNCMASIMWPGIGRQEGSNEGSSLESVLDLAKLFRFCGGDKQPAWTVRESSALGAASLAAAADLHALRKHETVSTLLECTVQALKDRKFWRVRFAGLKLLYCLVERAGTTNGSSAALSISHANTQRQTNPAAVERQKLLEALLPYKEKMLKLARSSLTDSQSQVTQIGGDIAKVIVGWP